MGKRFRPAAEQRAASEAFYCTFGRHRTYKDYACNEVFEHCTICYLCQLAITENIRQVLFMPDVSIAMRAQERKKFELARKERYMQKVLEGKLPDEDVTGMVYYLRINGQIKIGYTANLRQRSRNYPPGSELLAYEPATKFTERERHQDFHRDLVKGREWFRESEALVQHMAALREVHGLPEFLMHQYTEPKATG